MTTLATTARAARPAAFDNPPLPVMEITTADSGRGIHRAVKLPDGRTASLFSNSILMKSDVLGKTFREFDSVFAAAASRVVERNQSGLYRAALAVEQTTFLATVRPAAQHAIRVTREARQAHQARLASAMTWNRDAEPNSTLRSDIRRHLLGLSVPERIAALNRADFATTVSALEGGAEILGIEPTAWSRFEDHARVVIVVHKTGLDGRYSLQPTLDAITATGPDPVAARATGDLMRRQLQASETELKAAEDYLQAVAKFGALVGNCSPSEILGLE